jgi:hypothetical protein
MCSFSMYLCIVRWSWSLRERSEEVDLSVGYQNAQQGQNAKGQAEPGLVVRCLSTTRSVAERMGWSLLRSAAL